LFLQKLIFSQGDIVENLSKRCGGFLKKLSLKGCEEVDDKTLRVFSQNCANLSHLNLYKCKKITDQWVASADTEAKFSVVLDLSFNSYSDLISLRAPW